MCWIQTPDAKYASKVECFTHLAIAGHASVPDATMATHYYPKAIEMTPHKYVIGASPH